jgi:hypothetical protein
LPGIDDMRFDTGETLRFDGSGWGVGLGATEVSFWADGGSRYIGIFVAGSIGAGLGSFGGDGKFEEA